MLLNIDLTFASATVELEDKTRNSDTSCDFLDDCIKWLNIYFHKRSKVLSQPIPRICHLTPPQAQGFYTFSVYCNDVDNS